MVSGARGSSGGSGNSSNDAGSTTNAAPATASTKFNITPSFQTVSGRGTVSATVRDGNITVWHLAMTPSLKGFELVVKIYAPYKDFPGADNNNYGTPSKQLGVTCIDIDAGGGNQYEVYPLQYNLVYNSGAVWGTITYSAIVPGSYVLDLGCTGNYTTPLGKLSIDNLGIAAGSTSNMADDAMVVYGVNTSAADTVVKFGAIRGIGDSSPGSPTSQACLVQDGSSGATWHPAQSAINQEIRGTWDVDQLFSRSWFETGTLTFNESASQIKHALLDYPCQGTNSAGITMP
ncbi:MAG TPA: hypothetical protein VGS08_02290 [Candidatus Saccharimonadales bacterium]|nr:hypothetical protein [Candidatus Saccharimonadales bacterium]